MRERQTGAPVFDPLVRRGWHGEALTGVGRYKVRIGTAPHPPPAGGTFPQGKVRLAISWLLSPRGRFFI